MQQKFSNSFLFLLTVFCPYLLPAQDTVAKVTKPGFGHTSLYYDFPKNYGASAGVDFPLKCKIKITADKSGRQKSLYRDLIFNADIGFYRNRFNHTGVFLNPSVGKRYSKGKPFYFEWLAGAGVVRTFYDGIVYTVDENGKVTQKKDYGRWYASASIATTFGWNFENKQQPKPFALQLKPVLWFQFPYNSFMLPHLSIEAGVKYHIENFTVRIKQTKSIKK